MSFSFFNFILSTLAVSGFSSFRPSHVSPFPVFHRLFLFVSFCHSPFKPGILWVFPRAYSLFTAVCSLTPPLPLAGSEKGLELTPVAAISVHLLTSDGAELQVNEPVTVSVPLPADCGLKENDHVPAWRFDPGLGVYSQTEEQNFALINMCCMFNSHLSHKTSRDLLISDY